MALKATICKASVNVADLDRQVFLEETLTLAQHPSETTSRLMLRLLAWICHADTRLQFTRGLCADDEPEIWRRNDHQGIELWIELGLPDEKRLRKASHRAGQVFLYAYNGRAGQIWWQQNQEKLRQLKNLTIVFLDDPQLAALADMAGRNLALQATLQDGLVWLSAPDRHLEVRFEHWLIAGDAQ
ncbi:YaeQ family protein [Pantoea sp. 1.19]|uniref:YaeQ family protein n=1 Tax=Pantoea sp. 1.19 TaxID=1925589 RepID=UPI0009491622|nr:YaeQ family protein [Pantoea sp. 1.19]